MKKIIHIDGMSCAHCQASVEKALNSLPNVATTKVDLKKKQATVTLNAAADDAAMRQVVEDAGFKVTGIEDKKGLFG